MEIGRFTHDNVEYVVGSDTEVFNEQKVSMPYILATSKKAKKKRGYTLSEKKDNLFKRLTIKNPISFYKKIYRIYNEYLKSFNYVTFQAYKDDKEKRERVYVKALERMGFKVDYLYICPWDKTYHQYVLCRDGYELKKKVYSNIFKRMYGSWILKDGEWIEEK